MQVINRTTTAALLALSAIATNPAQAIIGGTEANPGDWPFMAAVFDNNTGQFVGGGVLVSERIVVTAARNVFYNDDFLGHPRRSFPEDVSVVLGMHRLDDVDISVFTVNEVIVQQRFDLATQREDLAVLVLNEPATGFEPVPLIGERATLEANGREATALGWGATSEGGQPAPALRQGEVNILRRASYTANYSNQGIGLTANMMVAGRAGGGVDTCDFDRGGPLLVRNEDDTGWVLAGLSSFGVNCGQAGFPGVYTRMGAYSDYLAALTTAENAEFAAFEGRHGVSGLLGDSNGDGLPHVLDFALAIDPAGNNTRERLPVLGTVDFQGTLFPSLTFTRPAQRGGATYRVERSTNLLDWVQLDEANFVVGEEAGEPGPGMDDVPFNQVTFRADIPFGAARETFMRLLVSPSGGIAPSSRPIAYPGIADSTLLDSDPPDPSRDDAVYFSREYTMRSPGGSQPVHLVLTAEFEATVQVFNPAGAEVTRFAGGSPTDFDFRTGGAADYTIRVSTVNPGETGRFRLRVEDRFPTIAMPNTTVELVGPDGNLTSGDDIDPSYSGVIFYKDDFKLTGARVDQRVGVIVNSTEFNPFVYIVNAETGEIVRGVTADGIVYPATVFPDPNGGYFLADANTGIFGDPTLSFRIEAGVNYYIRVTSTTPGAVGAYSLRIQNNTPVPLVLQSGRAAGSGNLNLGDEFEPTFLAGGFGSHHYKDDFLIENHIPGATTVITLAGTFDSYLLLYDADTGFLLASDDDSRGGFQAQLGPLGFTLEAGRRYLVRVSTFCPREGCPGFSAGTGSYNIGVAQAP